MELDCLDCLERQLLEAESLEAIFEGDERLAIEITGLAEARNSVEKGSLKEEGRRMYVVVMVTFSDAEALQLSSVRLTLPAMYPMLEGPDVELGSRFLQSACKTGVNEILSSEQGNECLFQIIQLLAEAVEEGKLRAERAAGDVSGEGTPGSEAEEEEVPERPQKVVQIIHSEPYTERKSTFQAFCARINSVDEVDQVMEQLLSIKKVAAATHNMVAYRIENSSGHTTQDYDDDGETAAGSRMLHMMIAARAMNCMVVVSRWYGGVKLGPSRFAIINNVARDHLKSCGFLPEKEEGKQAKK
ncbi:UPF0029 domain-containing protein [Chloropicon primus]|uniref:UPF0029 domain-containing protein n=1 Tax=Chloropicon primus TaxID=1764295 RepID=A0A5B8MBR9_9CHLO|nr:UPF0029 domain-containing protein [Chloropicon primus]UPQ97074.1 UPF0029 domain-containing protein [Chloropicon primus]|eukprot:QDZ17858.1 UPF0029 domain-containing protein [Chloropicon primus]